MVNIGKADGLSGSSQFDISQVSNNKRINVSSSRIQFAGSHRKTAVAYQEFVENILSTLR